MMLRILLVIAAVVTMGNANSDASNTNNNGQEQIQSLRQRISHQTARSLGYYYTDTLVDGLETSYDEYSQAWRMLGAYIDCGDDVDTTSVSGRRNRRRLEDNANDGANGNDAGGNDAGNEDAAANDNAGNEDAAVVECKRYLLWAAYVDLDYEGNGLREYQIYNPHTKKWDKTMCEGEERCVKMDCHLPSNGFKLLGFFKEEYPIEFLKVLSARQGSCTWKDETASIETTLESLPATCTQSKTPIDDGSSYYLYFDIQPTYDGGINVGLYTDASCINPYTFPKGSEQTVTSVLNTYYQDETDYSSSLLSLNSMLDDFKVCQPCRTYDLTNVADADGDGDSDYVCNDSAGSEGVNMCSIFATKTTISKASFHDVAKASSQTTIVRTYAATDVVETWWQKWGFLLISSIVFVTGMICFCSIAVKRKRTVSSRRNKLLSGDKQQPLIHM